MYQNSKVQPISQGQVQGKVVYFRSKTKEKDYQGKIVVMEDLDFSEQVSVLEQAQGIIARRGGFTSHGATLAREYRVPCFLFSDAKAVLPEGAEVSIDQEGSIKGQIKFLKKTKDRKEDKGPVVVKEGEWALIKPRRKGDKFSRFSNSFLEPAVLTVPKMLLDYQIKNKKAGRRDDAKGIWVKNYPLPAEIGDKIIQEPRWFAEKIKEQKEIYQSFKKYIKNLQQKIGKGVTLQESLEEIFKAQKQFVKIYPFVYLICYPINSLEQRFCQLASSFLSVSLATKLFDQIGRSAYSRAIARRGIKEPRLPKTIDLPAQPFIWIEAEQDYSRRIKLSSEIKKLLTQQPKSIQKHFLRYLEVLPILTELNDELCYVNRIFGSSLVAHLLEIIASELVQRKKIKKEIDIVSFSLKEIAWLVKGDK